MDEKRRKQMKYYMGTIDTDKRYILFDCIYCMKFIRYFHHAYLYTIHFYPNII